MYNFLSQFQPKLSTQNYSYSLHYSASAFAAYRFNVSCESSLCPITYRCKFDGLPSKQIMTAGVPLNSYKSIASSKFSSLIVQSNHATFVLNSSLNSWQNARNFFSFGIEKQQNP